MQKNQDETQWNKIKHFLASKHEIIITNISPSEESPFLLLVLKKKNGSVISLKWSAEFKENPEEDANDIASHIQ